MSFAGAAIGTIAGHRPMKQQKPPPIRGKRFWHEAVRYMRNENGQAPEDIPGERPRTARCSLKIFGRRGALP